MRRCVESPTASNGDNEPRDNLNYAHLHSATDNMTSFFKVVFPSLLLSLSLFFFPPSGFQVCLRHGDYGLVLGDRGFAPGNHVSYTSGSHACVW